MRLRLHAHRLGEAGQRLRGLLRLEQDRPVAAAGREPAHKRAEPAPVDVDVHGVDIDLQGGQTATDRWHSEERTMLVPGLNGAGGNVMMAAEVMIGAMLWVAYTTACQCLHKIARPEVRTILDTAPLWCRLLVTLVALALQRASSLAVLRNKNVVVLYVRVEDDMLGYDIRDTVEVGAVRKRLVADGFAVGAAQRHGTDGTRAQHRGHIVGLRCGGGREIKTRGASRSDRPRPFMRPVRHIEAVPM